MPGRVAVGLAELLEERLGRGQAASAGTCHAWDVAPGERIRIGRKTMSWNMAVRCARNLLFASRFFDSPVRPLPRHPSCGVGQDLERDGLLVDRVGLVAGAVVEDLALAEVPDHPAPEPLAARPALLEDDLVGVGDVERLVVHLGLGELEGRGCPRRSGGRASAP